MLIAGFNQLRTSSKRFMAAIHDIGMACLALLVTLGARYGFAHLTSDPRVINWTIGFAAVSAVVFWLFGLGRGIWRFASITDLKTICLASATVILVFLIMNFLANRLDGLPRSMPILTWINMIVLIGAPRLAYRALKDGWMKTFNPLAHTQAMSEYILLVGHVADADQVIRTYGLETSPQYRVAGIVEYREGRVGREVRGVSVLGDVNNFSSIISRLHKNGIDINAVVVVTPRGQSEPFQRLAAAAAQSGIAVRRASLGQFETSHAKFENVTLEDLLGRPSVSLDLDGIRALIQGRVVLITGAGGSIGSELVRQVAAHLPQRLVLLDHSEYNLFAIDREMEKRFSSLPRLMVLGDVRNAHFIRRIMQAERPAIVFHAAALKHVPMLEINPCEGALTNVIGTRHVADAAVEVGVEAFVMISTDKAIRPTSIMGATKRFAETYCQALDTKALKTRFITVRFGNVLGSTGSVVPLFKQQILEGGPVTITHPDMKRYFMVTSEATELVLQAASAALSRPDERGRIFVLDMGEPIKIVDLARTMIALSGLRPDQDIPIVFTGLRPGERLFEEIFDETEATVPSGKEGIFIAKAGIADFKAILLSVARLERAANDGDGLAVRAILRTIVPALPYVEHVERDARVVPFLLPRA